MTAVSLPTVSDCAVTGCSYNHDGCHAAAITVTGSGCGTFFDVSTKGGLDTVTAGVGACQRSECSHNANLECTASSIRVGPGQDLANCLTYSA